VTNSAFIRTWAALIFPGILFVVLVVFFAACPAAIDWPVSGSFEYLPYILFGTALVLGGVFAQSRILFLCLLFASVALLADYSFFWVKDVARGMTVVMFSTIYVPSFTALFYRLSERGLWTSQAAIRGVIVVSTALVTFMVSMLPELNDAVLHAEMVLFRRLSGYIRIPLIGMIAFIASLPFLFIKKKHESPLLGKLLAISMLFIFGGLNHPVAAEHTSYGKAMLLVFMSGGAVTLIWAVLESSWRSANIDELTELPGRRVLKNHMVSLGESYAIAVLDLDHFKKINDKYGHETGDQVLRFIAMHLNRNLAGKAYRYGGEEFVIVCEHENYDQTVEALDLLRRAISGRKFWIRSKTRPKKKPEETHSRGKDERGESITVTVSIGVARNSGRHASPQEVLQAADKALYKAKKEGRDRTRTAN
jgi:diguanylate cyclase (GGDEF)-like protein